MSKNILYSGQSLREWEALTYGTYKIVIEYGCTLALYDNGERLWGSNTGGIGEGCYVTLQSDGNLVIYDKNNFVVWASNSNQGEGKYSLILQEDGDVVIYGPAIWATNTKKIKGVSGGMFMQSKATIFGGLPSANKIAANAKAATYFSMVINE